MYCVPAVFFCSEDDETLEINEGITTGNPDEDTLLLLRKALGDPAALHNWRRDVDFRTGWNHMKEVDHEGILRVKVTKGSVDEPAWLANLSAFLQDTSAQPPHPQGLKLNGVKLDKEVEDHVIHLLAQVCCCLSSSRIGHSSALDNHELPYFATATLLAASRPGRAGPSYQSVAHRNAGLAGPAASCVATRDPWPQRHVDSVPIEQVRPRVGDLEDLEPQVPLVEQLPYYW